MPSLQASLPSKPSKAVQGTEFRICLVPITGAKKQNAVKTFFPHCFGAKLYRRLKGVAGEVRVTLGGCVAGCACDLLNPKQIR